MHMGDREAGMLAGVEERPDPRTTLLLALANAEGPIGTRQARQWLIDIGYDVSESTTSRRLRDLDSEGLTMQVGAKGRVLTPLGRAYVSDVLRNGEREALLRRAAKVETADDLLNVLKARRALEPEAVRDAANRATESDIAELRELVRQHNERLGEGGPLPRHVALTFHRRVTGLTRNPLLQAALGIVLDESLDRIEATLDVILQSHHLHEESATEHAKIVEALSEADGARAERIMRDHLSTLIAEVEDFALGDERGLLDRLLTWSH